MTTGITAAPQVKARTCITMPIDGDSLLYLTGCIEKPVGPTDRIEKPVGQKYEPVRVRFAGSPGFMPAWMLSWVLRFMQSPRPGKSDDSRIIILSETEAQFRSGPVTIRAKKFGTRIAMRVSVYLRERESAYVREIDSPTCTELEERITDMRSALNRYKPSEELPEIAEEEDENDWFESFHPPSSDTQVGSKAASVSAACSAA